MPTIEVTCECGRVYVLSADKEGRKLQCRRCGAVIAIRRDAAPGVVIPFHGAHDEGEDEITRSDQRARQAGQGRATPRPVPARSPLRRCPRCGFQDDPTIVICVRCSFDFRDQEDPARPVEPTPPADEGTLTKSAARLKADLVKIERACDERCTKIETLAKISFVPLVGLVPGVAALVLSSFGNAPLEQLPAPPRKALESRRGAARLMAIATFIMWTGVIGFYFLVYRPQQRHEIRETLALGCRSHLETLGKWIREARDAKGRFPADERRTLAEGLREAAEGHGLGESVLTCPLLGGERYAIDTGLPAIDAKTNDQYLIAWDSVPHAEADGTLRYNALRADGRVEDFRTTAQFEKGRARPSQRFQLETSAPASVRPENTPPDPGFEARRKALIQLAQELEVSDPKLETKFPEAEFHQCVGLAPLDAAIQIVRYGGDDLRHATARLFARLDLPGPEMLRCVSVLERDADPETRFTLILGLKRTSAPAWLDACGILASEGLPTYSDQALALLVAEAKTGLDGLRRVLARARDRRQFSKTVADQPIFSLPPDIYAMATQLLDDPEVGAEALAVLSRAGPEVEKALEPVFESSEPHARELAFRALRASLAWRDAPRASLHERLKSESDRNVRAVVLQGLLDSVDVETTKRALEALRTGPPDSLTAVARRVLNAASEKSCLIEIVCELEKAGPARDEALAELRRNPRLLDERLSEVLAQKGPYLDVTGQESAVGLAALRFDEVSQRFLLRQATSSSFVPVREAAWKGLDGARLPEKLRSEAQEDLASRLSKENDPSVRSQILTLLARYEFRSPSGLSALEQLARKPSEKEDVRERAVQDLALSNDPRAVTMLVELVDGLSGHPKWLTTVKLRELTSSANQPTTTSEWRRVVHQAESDVKKKLKEREEKERSELRDRQDRVEERVKELRARSS